MTENRFTGTNHDYIRDDSHAFILREPSRCIDCGRCANVCAEVVGAACYDFMRIGFDTLVTTPLDMSLNDTPCVSCGRCAETCPTGALMPKPRVLQKYEVDESRCILCGICVDACPYDALRDGADFELAHTSREEPMIDLMAMADDRPRDRGHATSASERDWAAARGGRGGRSSRPSRLLPMLPPSLGRARGERRHGRQRPAHRGPANGHAHGAARARRPRVPATPTIAEAGGVTLPEIDPDRRAALGRRRSSSSWRRHARRRRSLVVSMRDIIRCGLAMIVCFAALAGLYVMLGAPLVAAAQVLVYIGAISVLDPVRDHAHPDEGRPGRLVFHTQAGRPARRGHRARHHPR